MKYATLQQISWGMSRCGYWANLTARDRRAFQLGTTNREDGARLDVVSQSFWSNDRQTAFFYVRVFNPFAPTYRRSTLAQSYKRNEMEKKRAYEQRVREIEHGSFTPLVFSAAGMGPAAAIVYKKLASMLADECSSWHLLMSLGMFCFAQI